MLDNILRSTNLDSYIFSAFVTFTLLLLAHIAGKQSRQIWSAYQEKYHFSKIASALLLLVVMLFFVAALTIGRSAYTAAGALSPVEKSSAKSRARFRTQDCGVRSSKHCPIKMPSFSHA